MTLNHTGAILWLDDLKSSRKEEKDLTDSEALRKLIESRGLKMKYVADYLGLSAYGLQLKVDNRQEFKTSEVAALCELLEINSLMTKEKIFFAKKDDLKSLLV